MDLIELAGKHAWVAIASIVIGLLLRLSKSDTVFPIDIPSRWRPVVAFALGVASGVIEAVATGKPWPQAITGGIISAAIPVLGHGAVISGLAGGKEIPVPGLMAKGDKLVEALESKRDVAVAAVKAIETEQIVAQIKAEDADIAKAAKAEKEPLK